jgi:hypothetical protein
MLVSTVADDVTTGNAILKALTDVSVVGILWMICAHRRHGMVLCPLCAVAVPLDGAERAATRATTLLWAHRIFTRRYIVFQVAGAVAAYIVSSTVLKHVSLLVYWVGGLSAIEAYLMRVHQPLQPWCPYCHWDDDGDHRAVPDPVPPSGAVVVT